MATFSSYDGTRIAYDVWGDAAGPPVLLHHGFAVNGHVNWVAPGIVQRLVDAGHRVVALDARGHGRSDKPHDPAAYGEGAMAGDVSALLDELGWAEVALVGYSMGAIVSLVVATREPRVARLVVGGIGAGVVDLGGVDTRVASTEAIERALTAEDPADIPAATAGFRALADATGADRVALAAVVSAARSGQLPLDRITAPTLVVAGTDDLLAAQPERLAAAIPGARLVLVPGDHLSAVGRPELAAAVLDFLAPQPA